MSSASRPEDTRDPGGQIHPATPPNSPETKIKKYEQKGFDPMDSLISSRSEPQEGPSDTAILLNEEKILLQSPVPIEEEPSNVSIQIDEYATVTDVRNKHPELDIFIVRRELERKNPGLIRSWLINSPRNKRLSYFVSNRDIVFVVDNAPTMRPWWALVSFVVETMAMNLTGLDKDGLDLLFTGTDKFRLKGKKADAPSKFLKNIREATPNDRSMNTDMAASLGTIFDEYIRTPQEKGMTLLVFTDGLWTGGAEDDAVEKALVKFITRTKDYKMDRQMKRRFSIEFIYFGHDQKAIDRLRALDDEIKTKHELPDIVDHEPWTGDVDKMITGSFLESKDVQKPDAGLSPPGLSRVDSNTPSMNSLSSPTQPSKRSSFFGNRKGKSAETR
ncbi:hypothetical protein EJ05DRAFT_76652 [Pseudovirgaria hyperparasitica]|uniref:VWFA domain-containing protein n=1 Tax=Pseudovirgaria hyperparasitica TaxID=470096 RepID=A0A6A6W1G1_9PEZI|nr:uncharacterized protein EJ05DRAFT_76652 [Pseudovirgaria hyperparasitica]KAF2756758.1 hypothetical protein EJ05DRAFT_76652 [Pseudovirgaria hyperparasitica]